MFKHNLLISFRSFKRFKGTFLINLFGLASGLACTFLIYLWVSDEMNTDKFYENEDRIYQILSNRIDNGQIVTRTSMPGRLSEELMARFPEVEAASMVWTPEIFGTKGYVTLEEEQIRARPQYVNPAYIQVTSLPLVSGNTKTALKNESDVLISESLAIKLYGTTENLIGNTIDWNESRATTGVYMIAGVFKNLPKNSTLQFDLLLNVEVMMKAYKYMENWGNTNPDALVLLKEGASPDDFNKKIEKLIQSKVQKSKTTLFAQKFSERYLNGNYENGEVAGGRIAYVNLFSIVALIILVIACINFMNLSTAKAASRLKEIGVKKAIGAQRRTLIGQYFTESFLLTFLGVVIAFIIVNAILPQFNQATGKSLSVNLSLKELGFIGLIMLITGILAGSYPALYLSRLKTTESLKGKLVKNFSELMVRKGLVVFQFAVSVILIFSVLIISKQVDYIQKKNLGYDRNNVVKFDNTGIDDSAYEGFLASLETISGVISTASTGHDLTGDHGSTRLSWPGQDPDQNFQFINLEMSSGFIETMGIELIQGRTFERNRQNEEGKIIFNETAIKLMGLKDPIGKVIKLWGDEREIIGVVKDFHAESLYETIQPTLIQAYPILNSTIVKIQGGTIANTLGQIEDKFKEFSKGLPFEYKFLDTDYMAMYKSEQRISMLSKFFAAVAIIISCLGLLGLTIFTAERRTKEIGIRKVLGSGNWRIVRLLSMDFTKMVTLSLLIGLPTSYLMAERWLQGFAYGTKLTPMYSIFCGVFILAIAWFTVGFHTLKAARRNPVTTLRSE
ncbi:ABC transporter permease [Roseivirga misakiensis]|uniref:Uncharacterized protein n=1 Tax=Roseivirga misakiensis TaxID=1563681 RepID=A0A1E5T2C5_9BACT|nr:ABC transporter permease [Roseivirga misakiensis]OEK05522.1 hypothetical protein BFP71_09610 [Roseivirga misakiensis]